jgi:methylenetetrahydrofolate dehydrogenase (NADP+)/methenyltetrahydrofolate cyclohydrolase
MTASVIDGKGIADAIRANLKEEVSRMCAIGITPKLHVILIGQKPESLNYVRIKERSSKEIGMEFELEQLPESTKESELINHIKKLNVDPSVNGIIVQLPLPSHINRINVLGAISPEKDVDGLTPLNMGRLLEGDETLSAATSKGIIRLFEASGTELTGKNVVIINRSLNVGKPLISLLLNRNATVTICHSFTKDVEHFTRTADIVICAVGKPSFLTGGMVRKGSVVIDVGLTYVNGKGIGDVDASVKDVASRITTVPHGVGPMTVAMLLENTVLVTKKQHGI